MVFYIYSQSQLRLATYLNPQQAHVPSNYFIKQSLSLGVLQLKSVVLRPAILQKLVEI